MASKTLKFAVFITLITLFSNNNAYAQKTPQFTLPIDCTLGETCWIANYVDVNPDETIHQDFMCNAKTYEGHKGTDFALKNRTAMKEGVNVLAAADGTILRVRDGENDDIKPEALLYAIKAANKDCGNGVIINHDNGLQTFYCHLKKDSIIVKPKQNIKTGDIIGQVGQSGFSEFPHLHFAVIWENGHIDPFTGMLKDDGCGKFKNTLWKDKIEYAPYAVFDGGFTTSIPDFHKGGKKEETISRNAKALVFWSSFYQIQKDDEVSMEIKDPNGKTFASRTAIQKKDRALQHFYTGRKTTNRKLIPGTYTATTTIKSNDHSPQTHTFEVEVK